MPRPRRVMDDLSDESETALHDLINGNLIRARLRDEAVGTKAIIWKRRYDRAEWQAYEARCAWCRGFTKGGYRRRVKPPPRPDEKEHFAVQVLEASGREVGDWTVEGGYDEALALAMERVPGAAPWDGNEPKKQEDLEYECDWEELE